MSAPRSAGSMTFLAYLVHGEPTAAEFLRERITERLRWTAVVPRPEEKVLLP